MQSDPHETKGTPMKLLHAIDIRSDTASDEVVEAVQWATTLGATLDLAFVDDYAYSAHRIRNRLIREQLVAQWGGVQQSHRGELVRLVETLPEAVRGQPRYLQGRPAPALLGLEGDYDLMIVSTRGHRGLTRAFLGSVAERLVRESGIPVLVLRRGEVTDGDADS
ncbi:MAG: universal stress protein [Myxococcota bacterium]